jgi:hypothetical protein
MTWANLPESPKSWNPDMNQDLSILQLVLNASIVVQLVMLLLVSHLHRQLGRHFSQAVLPGQGQSLNDVSNASSGLAPA